MNEEQLESVPDWLIQEAVKTEYEDNWMDAFVEVNRCEVPVYASII